VHAAHIYILYSRRRRRRRRRRRACPPRRRRLVLGRGGDGGKLGLGQQKPSGEMTRTALGRSPASADDRDPREY